MTQPAGTVTIVGAGPGDPGLITVRGFQALQQAEVVFYDYLVNPIILRQAGLQTEGPQAVELVCLGRHGEGRILSQQEINEKLVLAAQAGKRVVRLKGGDPGIFGRTVEEIMALDEAAIPYQVVPGVTSALAASSVAGIPLTDRRSSSAVVFVTGHECDDKASSLDLKSLAQFPGTLVFYMGVTTAPRWSQELIAHGKRPETPVAIIRRCGLPGQKVIRTKLDQLTEDLAPGRLRPPAIIVVGEVAAFDAAPQFFNQNPLRGKTVLVTRPERQATEMVVRLNQLGATPIIQPAIDIQPPEDWGPVDRGIENLSQFDWLVFSSANGVQYFLDRILKTGRDLRALGSCKLAAIGPATVESLAVYHLQADLQPEEYRAEALADALIATGEPQRCLLLRASRGREVLAERLTTANWQVQQVVVYRSTDVTIAEPETERLFDAGEISWVTVTSSAIARSLVKLYGKRLEQTQLAAISPLTAGILAEAGHPAEVVATEYTTEGLIEAILKYGEVSFH